MTVRAGAVLTFRGYQVEDDRIRLRFECADPGAGEVNEYTILLTDAEVAVVTTQVELRTLIVNKLRRKLRAENIATKLDPFIGASITVS